MTISCCSWALTGTDFEVLDQLSSIGLKHIDFRPFDFVSPEGRSHLQDSALTPTCMATAFGMPSEAALDSHDENLRNQAIDHIIGALNYAAELEIKIAYLLPGENDQPAKLARYESSILRLADHAESLNIKLCIEHFPGKGLPTAVCTLDFISRCDHENLYLLFDIGHAQISGESPIDIISRAGDRLGYVHLDDNDGNADLHWPLYEGVLTPETLSNTFEMLKTAGYTVPVSIEMHPELPDPLAAIKRCFIEVEKIFDQG